MNRFRLPQALLTVAFVAIAASSFADWPQYLGPNRDATSPETGLLKTWPEAGPTTVWSIPVGEGYASAAIRDGEVYFLDREKNKSDTLRCLSLKDGSELWSYAYDAPGSVGHDGSRNPPTVDEKYVYSVGMAGDFLCTDRKTHKPVWQKNFAKDYKAELPRWGFSQSPYLYKNLVIVSVQAPDASVVAFDRESGKEVWKSQGYGLPGYVSPFVATLAGVEQVIAITASNKGDVVKGATVGLSPKDGSLLWKYEGWQCFIPIPNPTVLPGDKLFITAGYNAGSAIIQIQKKGDGLEAVEVKKIEPQICGSQIQQPIVYKDHIFVNSNSNERQSGFSCYDLDGNLKWNTGATPGLPLFDKGSFILADNMFIFLDGKTGILYLLEPNAEKYTELAHAPVIEGRELWAPLALTDGKLIVRSQDTMKCLNLKG